ncbi:hypothetical protein FAI41_04450 [Acetobacteraceae bacterium]|nr:hypothetical protein FAI41_04450 [Acetobacteraceae bacterium]
MCQLFSLASGILGALNPMEEVTLRVFTGQLRNPDYSITPEFKDYPIFADLQSLNSGELLLAQNINQQAETRSAYVKGTFHALNRPLQTGGDLIILKDGSEWLITSILEAWGGKDDWCKILMTRQKPSAL